MSLTIVKTIVVFFLKLSKNLDLNYKIIFHKLEHYGIWGITNKELSIKTIYTVQRSKNLQ